MGGCVYVSSIFICPSLHALFFKTVSHWTWDSHLSQTCPVSVPVSLTTVLAYRYALPFLAFTWVKRIDQSGVCNDSDTQSVCVLSWRPFNSFGFLRPSQIDQQLINGTSWNIKASVRERILSKGQNSSLYNGNDRSKWLLCAYTAPVMKCVLVKFTSSGGKDTE